MCGIGGYLTKKTFNSDKSRAVLEGINEKLLHRGPDGEGIWSGSNQRAGLCHRRLSIIDIEQGAQPMISNQSGAVISYNGELYNFLELREEIGQENFVTKSDTEVILRAYEKWGPDCVLKFRGMFAFTIWDDVKKGFFIARDHFGIKPFYYTFESDTFLFASEVKALLPFLDNVAIDEESLSDYFIFQYYLGKKTLFKDIKELKPGYRGFIDLNLDLKLDRYWDLKYTPDYEHTDSYFSKKVKEYFYESIELHLRSDVPVSSYLSGGLDSTLVASLANGINQDYQLNAFTGRFPIDHSFDESAYAANFAKEKSLNHFIVDIDDSDFVNNIENLIYHLDFPVAGPGSLPQYMVSKKVSEHNKVVLSGLGGDEIFGGYVRYLIAYFEQCIKGAIEGTLKEGNFVVTYESIIPNLQVLKNYKPLLSKFWKKGLFGEKDERYFSLINRRDSIENLIDLSFADGYSSFEKFKSIFWRNNVSKESYFDSMTHFDFYSFLPSLLHIEDRVSMAHGLESRVPMLDLKLVELLATVPSDIKFKNGELKRLLRRTFKKELSTEILNREDKMGFPVPLSLWQKKSPGFQEFSFDLFSSKKSKNRFYFKNQFDINDIFGTESKYSRNLWALMSLELWQRQFIDNHKKEIYL